MSSLSMLAACTSGPPAGYAEAVCPAYEMIAATSADWRAAGEAAAALDGDALAPILDRLEETTEAANASLADAPEWEPGEPFFAPLSDAVIDYNGAVLVFREGATAGDPATIADATARLERANDELGQATDAVPTVQEAGLDC